MSRNLPPCFVATTEKIMFSSCFPLKHSILPASCSRQSPMCWTMASPDRLLQVGPLAAFGADRTPKGSPTSAEPSRGWAIPLCDWPDSLRIAEAAGRQRHTVHGSPSGIPYHGSGARPKRCCRPLGQRAPKQQTKGGQRASPAADTRHSTLDTRHSTLDTRQHPNQIDNK